MAGSGLARLRAWDQVWWSKSSSQSNAGDEAGRHGVGHVGEDAGADAGALETLRPVDHGEVELGPEVDVGGDEVGELSRVEGDAGALGGFVPEGFAGEVAAVVGVAVGPVARGGGRLFAEAGDGAHARPGGGVGWAGEDHAVVEEDCLNFVHRVDCRGWQCG